MLYIFNVMPSPNHRNIRQIHPSYLRGHSSSYQPPYQRNAAESYSPSISIPHLIIGTDNHVGCRVLYGYWPDDDPQGAGSWTYGAPISIFRGQRSQRRSIRPRMILSRAGGTSDGGIEAKNKSYPSGLLHRRGPQTSGDVGDVFVGR